MTPRHARSRRLSPALAALIVAYLASAPLASAGTTDEACIAAANDGETLRKDVTKLTQARERLRACAVDECPAMVRDDCRKNLSEVDADLPSVVLIAEDASGGQVFDVKVQMDGAPLAGQLDGKPIAVDGGAHTFVFQRPGLAPAEVRMVLRAGQKNIEILARFAKPVPAPPIAPPPVIPAVVPEQPQPHAQPDKPASSGSPMPTVGLVLAGVGVVGLGIGTVFGLSASSKQTEANCPENRCTSIASRDKLLDAQSTGNLATVFFVGGVVLVAGGLAMYFFAPKAASPPSASARVRQLAEGFVF